MRRTVVRRPWTATGGWCTIPAVIFAARRSATKLLPLLVVLWLAFAVLGGVVFLPQHAGLDSGSGHEAGLGICAATAAALFVAVARRPRRPAPTIDRVPLTAPLDAGRSTREVATRPPAVPLWRTLQVFLN